jgi:hypothetical protein
MVGDTIVAVIEEVAPGRGDAGEGVTGREGGAALECSDAIIRDNVVVGGVAGIGVAGVLQAKKGVKTMV